MNSITTEELNIAYEKVKIIKKDLLENGHALPLELQVDIDRNPLTSEYFDNDSEFVIPFKLNFGLSWVGADVKNPVYFLTSTITILEEEDGDKNL